MTILPRALLICTLVIASSVSAQINAKPHPGLAPYTACKFEDGLAMEDIAPLPEGVKGRTVATLTGTAHVALLGGERVMFAYPDTDFFANVKVEQLPADSFEQGKKDLISNIDHI